LTVVAKQPVPKAWRRLVEPVARGAVGEVEIDAAVAVVVKRREAAGHGLNQALFGRWRMVEYESHAARGSDTKGLLLKGAYTLGKSKNFDADDDGWTAWRSTRRA
jgi:hypothetical protein